jgi:Outer membrane protein beta-barrel domain
MHTMISKISRNRLYSTIGRAAAVTFLAAAGTLGLHAQQSAGTASSLPVINLKTSLIAPLNLSAPVSSSDDLSYSSSVGSDELANAETFSLSNSADQPPPRRRYGRPNYNDSRTNADGSPKYDFFGGGGFGLSTGGTHNYLSAAGWGLQVGGGRNFNKKIAINLQFDYDHFGFQTATLNNLLAIYSSLGATDGNGNPISELGGTSHVWSFSLDPKYTFFEGDKYGVYGVIGVGFYHKTANFTTPGIAEYCDPFYGCIQYQANETLDKYTSNAPGFNAGIGMTYKFSRFASQRFYAEARYVFVDNSAKPFDISGEAAYFNAFPQNSAKTTYIPVKFGIRF